MPPVYLFVTSVGHDTGMATSIAQLTFPAKPHTAPATARPAAHLTIRRKILLAFLCLSVVTASLGAYAIRSVVALGYLTDQAIEGALLSIDCARSASAGFNALEAAVADYARLPHQAGLQLHVNALSKALDEELAVVAQRAFTPEAAQIAAAASTAVANWRAAVAEPAEDGRTNALAQTANRRLERLVDRAAGEVLEYQARAQAEVADAKFQMLLWTLAAMVLGGMIVTVLARRITGLIADVSAALCRIASGHADTSLPSVGADELGAMLTTIRTMQANIVAMTALEAAARRSKQPTPAVATEKSVRAMLGRKRTQAASAPSTADNVKAMF